MKFLDPETEGAVRLFLDQLPSDIRLERAILLGSRARGEATPDSDADLALILHERGNDGQTPGMLAGLAYQVFLDDLTDRDYDSAVNRSYYAMFDIARAALLRAGVAEDKLPRTHNGVIDAFRQHAVQSGQIDREPSGCSFVQL